MKKIIPVIMCGGAGTRVWPASRETMPKQFIPLLGDLSTFQETLRRLDPEIFDEPVVITNHDYRFLVQEQMQQIGVSGDIVLEPERRDSAAAVAVACELASQRADDAVVAVFAADHAVRDVATFRSLCRKAGAAASQGYIVTLGIKPTHPATGYGYIRPGALGRGGGGRRQGRGFRRKAGSGDRRTLYRRRLSVEFRQFLLPRRRHARRTAGLRAGNRRARRPRPSPRPRRDLGFLALDKEAFGRAPKTSIDYAVMERTAHAAVIPADIGWSDVGNWQAVWELSDRDAHGNSVRGNGVVHGIAAMSISVPTTA